MSHISNYGSIYFSNNPPSYDHVTHEIQKLENLASRTKCAVNALRFCFLPCTLVCNCISCCDFLCNSKEKDYYFEYDQYNRHIIYSDSTSCKCPSPCYPRQEHPKYSPPKTLSDIFSSNNICDFLGLLPCCSAQVNTRDFLTEQHRQEYGRLIRLKERMLDTRGPFPQAMKNNPDRRACYVGQEMIRLAGDQLFEPHLLRDIMDFAGPAAAAFPPIPNHNRHYHFHPAEPSRQTDYNQGVPM